MTKENNDFSSQLEEQEISSITIDYEWLQQLSQAIKHRNLVEV